MVDKNGCPIRLGCKVIWNDPETGNRAEYEVYDTTEEIVKLWADYGECEALPQECEVIK